MCVYKNLNQFKALSATGVTHHNWKTKHKYTDVNNNKKTSKRYISKCLI